MTSQRILSDREQERSAPDGQHPFGKNSLPAQFTPEEMAERERWADRRYEYVTCVACGKRHQAIDFFGSLHALTCADPTPPPNGAA